MAERIFIQCRKTNLEKKDTLSDSHYKDCKLNYLFKNLSKLSNMNKQFSFRHRSREGTSSKSALYYPQITLLRKPHIVGYMSVDVNRQYHSDLSQLKFLNEILRGTVSLDLNHNIDAAVKRTTNENDEKITLLLNFLLDQQPCSKQRINKPHFISYRRTLISIMCAAFETIEPVKIAATLFDGSIYLCSLETDTDKAKRKSRSKQEEKFCAWGYKFEQYLLSDFPNIPPNIHKPVIENEEFSLYYSSSLGNKQLLYGAQIDGLLSIDESTVTIPIKTSNVDINLEYLRKNEYVELKTNREIQNYKQERNFKRYKLFRCWCQCYLANLKGLLVGFRTDEGIVKHLQWFDTQEIIKYCRDEWHPQTAIDFLDYTLSFIQNSFKGENSVDSTTLQFEICNNRNIIVNKLQSDLILPNWYTEKIKLINAYVFCSFYFIC